MGGCETGSLDSVEPTLKFHPGVVEVLTLVRESGSGTVHGRQFDWGGLLLKSNGGVRRCAQTGRKSVVEYKGKSALNCETHKSSRYESRS